MEQIKVYWDQALALIPGDIPPYAWVAAVAVLLVVWVWLRRATAHAALQVIARMVLTIMLPLFIVLFVALFALATVAPLDTSLWQVVAGVSLAGMFWLVPKVDAARTRSDEARRMLRLFHAEIATYAAASGGDEALGEYGRQMIEIMQANPGFAPLVPASPPPPIFAQMAPRLPELPAPAGAAIAAFYAQEATLRSYVDAMQGPGTAQLAGERKINLYRDYVTIKRSAAVLAEEALTAIERQVRAKRSGKGREARAGL